MFINYYYSMLYVNVKRNHLQHPIECLDCRIVQNQTQKIKEEEERRQNKSNTYICKVQIDS